LVHAVLAEWSVLVDQQHSLTRCCELARAQYCEHRLSCAGSTGDHGPILVAQNIHDACLLICELDQFLSGFVGSITELELEILGWRERLVDFLKLILVKRGRLVSVSGHTVDCRLDRP